MANVAQATFTGGDVIIRCDDKWTCCQRAQAKQKTETLNQACIDAAPEGIKVRPKLTKATKRVKKRAQQRETRRMDRKGPAARAKGVTPACLAKILTEKTRAKAKVQMDHPVDTKWGGPSDPKTGLVPVDAKVNNFFGSVAKNTGDAMRNKKPPQNVESFTLICPGPCKPPDEKDKNTDFSAGAGKPWPDPPTNPVTPKPPKPRRPR
jgi:hypothetical protein